MGAYGRRFTNTKEAVHWGELEIAKFTTTLINVLTGNSRIKK